jgi:hypothetical protein
MHGGHLRRGGHHSGQHLDEFLHVVAAEPAQVEQLPVAHQPPHRIGTVRQPRRLDLAKRAHHQ